MPLEFNAGCRIYKRDICHHGLDVAHPAVYLADGHLVNDRVTMFFYQCLDRSRQAGSWADSLSCRIILSSNFWLPIRD